MKTLNLKLTGSENLDNMQIYIDGNQINFKRNGFKNLTSKYETNKDKVKIEVYKALDVGGVFWFITQLFFFLISVFGIFDVHYKNRFLGLQYESEVEILENSNITLKCNKPKENQKAFELETNLQITEIKNAYFIDEKAKKICKALKISKVFSALIIIAIVILCVVL